ncbi:MAG: LVIVD repeat-containing protein [Campylobacter sp.]|uniref:LVIVD repeat-containing protein n=1 Tax=Campylobacter sp. TaxID=205 RepID=UPI00360D0957
MIDPNVKKKREFTIYFTALIVILPFVFLYLKYADKEPESLAQNFTVARPQTPVQKAQISQNRDKSAYKGDVTIYKKDIINNSVQIPFEVRDMIISRDKKKLYTIGHDRDGISVIDISNLDHIKLLGLFYFPEAKYKVQDIQAAESNDGKSLYVASPNLGILRLDVTDPKNVNVATKFEAKGYHKIKLSDDNKLAYIKSIDGMCILDISSDDIKKIGEFISIESFNNIENGDIAIYSKKYILMSDFAGFHTLDVSDPKNIKEVYKKEDFKPVIHLSISPDRKYLYSNELHNFKIYDIENIRKIKFLKNYMVDNRIYDFVINKEGDLAYIARSRASLQDNVLRSIDILDISDNFEPERLRSYYMPEAKKTNLALHPDERHMIISFAYDGIVGVIRNDAQPASKEATRTQIDIKELEDSSKNIDKSKPVWDLPFSQNGFASVSMAVSTEDGYILAGEYQNAREPDLFIKVDKSGREIWRKIVDKSYQGRAKLIAAQMQSYYVIGNEEATYVIDKATHKIINKLPYPLKHIAPTDNDEFIACDYKNNIFRMDKNAKIIWKKQIDVSHLQDEFYIKYEYDPKDPTKKPTQREIKKPKEGLEKLIKTDDGNFLLFVKEFGITKFNPNGKIIFESKVQTDGYFEDMLDDDGAALVLFRSKNKYNMKTLKLLKLNNEGKIITKSNVYGNPDHFFSPGFIKYKEGGYIIGIKPYNSQQIFLSEIDSKGRALDEGYITNLGTEVAFHKMLEMDDQKVLLLGSAVPKYKRSREAFMIMLNLNQIVNRLNLSIENR